MNSTTVGFLVAILAGFPALQATAQDGLPFVYEHADHFWWYVGDIDSAADFFEGTLGLTLSPNVTYDAGSDAFLVFFEDGSYFEILEPKGQSEDLLAILREFVDRHEGAWKIGIRVSDTEAAVGYSRDVGLEPTGPFGGAWGTLGGISDLPEVMWTGVEISRAPGDLLFLWQFTGGWEELRTAFPELDPLDESRLRHRSTATGWRHPRIATWDIDRRVQEFERMGMRAGEGFEIPELQARAMTIALERGPLLLLEPAGSGGPVLRHLLLRGEGLMGIAITVQDLQGARNLIGQRLEGEYPMYRGFEGPSFRVPGAQSKGVAVTFVEWDGSRRFDF